MKESLVSRIVLVLLLVALAGCASIVGHPTQAISVSSTPSDATVVVTDQKGAEVFKGKTPAQVTLDKSDGSYWGKKSYTMTLSKQGYETQSVKIEASANGWYIFGNLLFGGLIGWFLVDPWNGNMYALSPEKVNPSLAETKKVNESDSDRSISVLLIDDVPAGLHAKMKPVH